METLEKRLEKRLHSSLYALIFLALLLVLSVLLEGCTGKDRVNTAKIYPQPTLNTTASINELDS